MKLNLSPLPAYIEQAVLTADKVYDNGFNVKVVTYAHKHALATQVMQGQEPSKEFIEAAAIEGMDPQAFAEQVASKPNLVMEWENRRRMKIMRIRNAKSIQEVDDLLKELRNV